MDCRDQKPYSTLIQKKLRARKAPHYTFPIVAMYICSNISHDLNRALRAPIQYKDDTLPVQEIPLWR